MRITPKQYAASLLAECQDTPSKEWPKILDAFMALLVKNGDLARWPQIENCLTELDNIAESVVDAEIISGRPVNPEVLEVMAEEVKRQSGRRSVNWKKSIDKKLMGGAVVRFDDKIVDISIAGNLKRLKEDLKN